MNSVICLLLLRIIIELISYTAGGKVACDFGYNFITGEFPIQYAVTELPLEYGCFTGEIEQGVHTWPGPPHNIHVDISSNDFTLSWQPPDDSSIQHLKGFLVRLFVEDFSTMFSMDPDICLLVNMSQSEVSTRSVSGQLVQDSVIRVQCRHLLHAPLDIRVYLTSLPLPSISRQYKEIAETIHFEVDSDRERQGPVELTTHVYNEENGEYNQDETDNRGSSVIAVCVVIVSTVVIVVTIFTVYKTMQHHRTNDQNNATQKLNNVEVAEPDLENNIESPGNTEPYYLPDKYRHIFMKMNSES